MIKKLMKSIREYKKDSLLSPAMVTLEVIMEVIIPMLMARLIDYGIQAQNLGYIWKMGILLAVTAMISLMFGVLSGFCSSVCLCSPTWVLWQEHRDKKEALKKAAGKKAKA